MGLRPLFEVGLPILGGERKCMPVVGGGPALEGARKPLLSVTPLPYNLGL